MWWENQEILSVEIGSTAITHGCCALLRATTIVLLLARGWRAACVRPTRGSNFYYCIFDLSTTTSCVHCLFLLVYRDMFFSVGISS